MKRRIPNGRYLNGAVWLDGQPVALNLGGESRPDPRKLLSSHLADQRAHIARLTERADRVQRYLDTGR